MDQLHNTQWRASQILNISATHLIPIFEFRVPKQRLRIHALSDASQFLKGTPYDPDADELQIWIPNLPEFTSYQKLVKEFGPPVRELIGVRLQGKASFHIWDHRRPDLMPIRAKFQRAGGWDGKKIFNGELAVENSVRSYAVIRDLDTQKPHPSAQFFPEPFGVTVPLLDGSSYSMILRAIPYARHRLAPHQHVWPLHGFLNSFQVRAMAQAQRRTDLDWIKLEYLKKLAEMIAHFQFEQGVWIEGHSQNMSIVVNSQTGIIEFFWIKDADDVMFAPFFWHLNRLRIANAKALPFRLNEHWESWGQVIHPKASSSAGIHATDFLIQSIAGVTNDRSVIQELSAQFVRHYLDAIHMNRDELSTPIQAILSELETGDVTNKTRMFVPTQSWKWRTIRNTKAAFTMIMQEIADQMTMRKFRAAKMMGYAGPSTPIQEATNFDFPAFPHFRVWWEFPRRPKSQQLKTIQMDRALLIYDEHTGRPLGSRQLEEGSPCYDSLKGNHKDF